MFIPYLRPNTVERMRDDMRARIRRMMQPTPKREEPVGAYKLEQLLLDRYVKKVGWQWYRVEKCFFCLDVVDSSLAWLSAIWVHPDFRGEGQANCAMQYICWSADEVGCDVVAVPNEFVLLDAESGEMVRREFPKKYESVCSLHWREDLSKYYGEGVSYPSWEELLAWYVRHFGFEDCKPGHSIYGRLKSKGTYETCLSPFSQKVGRCAILRTPEAKCEN